MIMVRPSIPTFLPPPPSLLVCPYLIFSLFLFSRSCLLSSSISPVFFPYPILVIFPPISWNLPFALLSSFRHFISFGFFPYYALSTSHSYCILCFDRHYSKWHFERIYGPKHVHLPTHGVNGNHSRYLRLHCTVHSQVQQHIYIGLSYPSTFVLSLISYGIITLLSKLMWFDYKCASVGW